MTETAAPAVCIVRQNYYPDGGHVRRNAETLARAGYDVSVIAIRRPGQPGRETFNGVHVYRLPVERRRGHLLRYVWEYAAFFVLAAVALAVLHARKRFRVVEVDNLPDVAVFSAIVPKLFGARVVFCIMDNMPELLQVARGAPPGHPLVRLLGWMERLSAAFADRVIVTQEMAREVTEARGTPGHKIRVVLNGPDESVFLAGPAQSETDEGAQSAPAGEDGRFQIVTHGTILRRFGIQTLIDALPRVAAAVPGVRLRIVGEGEYLPEIVAHAERNGVAHLVEVRGWVPVDDLPDLLRDADAGYVGMLCDLMLSNKLMEYVALGVPVVLSRWSVYERYFGEDAVRYFTPGDVDDLAGALIEMSRDPQRSRERAARASARYERLRWTVQREAYLGLYRELVPDRTGGERSPAVAPPAVARGHRVHRVHRVNEALLLAVHADAAWPGPVHERLAAIVADPAFDWDGFWETAHEQEVHPLVAHVLSSEPFAGRLSPAALSQAKSVSVSTLVYNMSVRAETVRVARAMASCGIHVVALKGVHLAQRLFGNLGARRVGDIDVLVQPHDLDAARRVLQETGYRLTPNPSHGLEEHAHHGVPYVLQRGPTEFVLELHWGLANPRFVGVDMDALWQRVLERGDGDGVLRALPAEETLVFLALHLPKHSSGVLRLLADVDRLVRLEGPELDWPLTVTLAHRWGVSALLYFALRRASLFFGTPVSSEVLRQLEPAAWRRWLVDALVGPRFVLHPPESPSLRRHRSLAAYCAMLVPLRRSLAAYWNYLYADPARPGAGVLGRAAGLGVRGARGLAWTGLVAASALKDGRQAAPPLLRAA